jgi:glutathione S-transferase
MPELGTAAGAQALERFFVVSELKRTGMQLFGYFMTTPVEQRDTIRVDAMLSSFHSELARVNGWLDGEASHCCGEALTLVDLPVFVYVATAIQLGLNCRDRYPGLHRLFEAMRERPAVANSWPSGWRAPLDLLG